MNLILDKTCSKQDRLNPAHSCCLNGHSKSRTCPASHQLRALICGAWPTGKQTRPRNRFDRPASANNCFCLKETWVKNQNTVGTMSNVDDDLRESFMADIGNWVWPPHSVGDSDVCKGPIFYARQGRREKGGRQINARCAKAYDCIDFLPSARSSSTTHTHK